MKQIIVVISAQYFSGFSVNIDLNYFKTIDDIIKHIKYKLYKHFIEFHEIIDKIVLSFEDEDELLHKYIDTDDDNLEYNKIFYLCNHKH